MDCFEETVTEGCYTMKLSRIFTTGKVKGTRNYLNTQKKYELLRTFIYFAIPISLFIAGIIQTEAGVSGDLHGFALFKAGLANPESRVNLLSIVAVLGLLPASKSLVNTIMFLRFHSLGSDAAEQAAAAGKELQTLYDNVFTSYKKSFVVGHLAVRGNTVCGYSETDNFEENEFYKHIGDILKLDGHKEVTVKIFTDLKKYTERLGQMNSLEESPEKTAAIIATLKSVSL